MVTGFLNRLAAINKWHKDNWYLTEVVHQEHMSLQCISLYTQIYTSIVKLVLYIYVLVSEMILVGIAVEVCMSLI